MSLEWTHLSKNAGGNCPDFLGRTKQPNHTFAFKIMASGAIQKIIIA
jgi:hypothetical protein